MLYLPIEIPERELQSKLLIAIHATALNVPVVIGNYWSVHRVARRARSGYFLYKDCLDARATDFFPQLREAGVKIGVLDEEGLIFPSMDFYLKSRIGKGLALPYVTDIFTWGEAQKHAIVNAFPELKDRISATGNPRIDLLNQTFADLYKPYIARIQAQHGRFVLINTNFGPGNYSPYFKRSYFDVMKSFGRINTPEDEQYYKARESYFLKLYKFYIQALRSLALRHPDKKFILRPHPVENHDNWIQALAGLDNVSVVYEGSAVHWIAAADMLIHTGCTTGLEAYIMGKPVVRLNPDPDDEMESPLPNLVSMPAFSVDEMDALLKRPPANSSMNSRTKVDIDPQADAMVNEMITNLSSGNAYAHLGDIVCRAVKAEGGVDPAKVRASGFLLVKHLFNWSKTKAFRTMSALPLVKNLPPVTRWQLRKQRFSGLTKAMLLENLSQLEKCARVESSGSRWRISVADVDAYIIERLA